MLITDKNKLREFYSDMRVWQLVPSVEVTRGGVLYASFYSGAESETLGNYCVLVRSRDSGLTWSEPVAAAYDGEMHRCFDSVVWLDPLGRLWFTWSRGHEDGVYGAICENPDEEEIRFGEEFFIGCNVMMNKPTALSSGEWLFPVASWNYWYVNDTITAKRDYSELYYPKYFNEEVNPTGAWVYRTADGGKSFERLGGCTNIQNRCCDEHIIYERLDGTLVMLIRTWGDIFRSFSYDRGRTWTDAYGSGIKNPSARFCVRRLRSGRLLMVNHCDFTKRNNLTAMLSSDDGETFSHKLLLDGRSSVSYPDIAEGDDGYIYVIYDRERGGYEPSAEAAEKCAREILVARFTENDVINGKITSEGGYTCRTVSKLGKYKGTRQLYTPYPTIDADIFVGEVADKPRSEIMEYICVYYSHHFLGATPTESIGIDAAMDEIYSAEDGEAVREALYRVIALLTSAKAVTQPRITERTAGGRTAKGYKEQLVDRVIAIMREDMTAEPDAAAIAESLGISAHYLRHVFLKLTGLTLSEHWQIHRLAEAKRLLVTTSLTAEEICLRTGIPTAAELDAMLLKDASLTAKEYRKAHLP